MTGRPAPPSPARRKGPRAKLKSERIQAEEPAAMTLPYDRLAHEMKTLPAWALHPSGLSMTREVSFPSSGPALLFVIVAGLLARLERRWPEISWARERVSITLRNLELGLTGRELGLARKLELLAARCQEVSVPEPPLGPASFTDLEELAEVTFLALRGLQPDLREDRGAARPGPLRLALEALPDWEPETGGDGLVTEFELQSESQAQDFLSQATELVEKEGWRVELLAAGRSVGAIVRPSDVRGLTEREIAAAAALERLSGALPAAASSRAAAQAGRVETP